MSPALQAHLRLITQIPRERIRTHEARLEAVVQARDRVAKTRGISAHRRETIARLGTEVNPETEKPWTVEQMADHLGISKTAVYKHRRVLAGRKYRWKKGA